MTEPSHRIAAHPSVVSADGNCMCTVLQKPPESFLVTAVRALFLRGDSEHIQIGFPVGGVPFQLVSSHLCSQCAVPA